MNKDPRFAFLATSFHESMFNAYEAVADIYSNGESEEAAIFEIATDQDEFRYQMVGLLSLPKGSGDLMHEFCKFAKVKVGAMDGIDGEGKWAGLSDFPEETFQLEMLLNATFPRNARNGIMRAPMNGCGTIEAPEPESELHRHQALCGVGVRLMRATRDLIGPEMTDDDTIIAAGRREFLISF